MSLLLSVAAALAVVGAGARLAPTRGRLVRTPTPRSSPALLATVDSLGLGVRRTIGGGRAQPAGGHDRLVGLAVLLAPLVLVGGGVVAVAIAGASATSLALRRLRSRRAQVTAPDATEHLPDLVDLLHLAVGSGTSLVEAFDVVVDQVHPDLTGGVEEVRRRRRGGATDVDAVSALATQWGEPALPLVAAATDHLRDGAAAGPALARVAEDLRQRRRRAAETRARRLPVLLLFPLVVCILPAFGLLTVVPLVSTTLDSLTGGPLEAEASCPATEGLFPCP